MNAALNALFSQFRTDPDLEKKGVRVEYLTGDDEADRTPPTFILARAGGANQAYNNALDNVLKPLRRRMAMDAVSSTELDAATKKVFIEHCVKGWENVKDADGKDIDFNLANATDLFKTLPDLLEDLRTQANKTSMFRLGNLEASVKN